MAWTAASLGVNLIGNILGNNAQKKAAKLADKRLVEGRDYVINRSGLQNYADTGVQANNAQAAALGIGGAGVPGQQEAFNQYLASTGYGATMKGASDAITANAAAKGLLNSGATLRGLQKTGAAIGQNYYGQYLNQVGDVANRGLSAAGTAAQAVTGNAAQRADVAQQAGAGQAAGIQNMFGPISDVLAYKAGGGKIF